MNKTTGKRSTGKSRPSRSPDSGARDSAPVLSQEASDWQKKILRDFEIEDEHGLLILRTAAEALDRLRDAQRILAREGVCVKDRWGLPKQHPATMVERDARTALLRSLKALCLDVELPGPMGRPPGR